MGTSPLSGKVAQFYAAGPGQDLSDKPIEVVNLRIKGAYEDDIDKITPSPQLCMVGHG